MPQPSDDAIAKRFRLVLDLFESGLAIMRQNLRREHPLASEARIERLLVDWLHARSDADEDSWSRPRRSVG
jgi:hypothetical protein